MRPFEHQSRDVNRVRRRRIEHRVGLGLFLPVESGGRDRQRAPEQRVAHDHQREAGGADVFLRAAVDDAVFRDVDDAREDVRRHVGDQRQTSRVGRPLVFDSADGLVGADVHVRRVLGQLPVLLRRHIREMLVLRRRGDIYRAVLLRFLDRFFRPFPGIDVVGDGSVAEKIHRNDGVFGDRAALQGDHLTPGRLGTECGDRVGVQPHDRRHGPVAHRDRGLHQAAAA